MLYKSKIKNLSDKKIKPLIEYRAVHSEQQRGLDDSNK